jgi:hypothetical protein
MFHKIYNLQSEGGCRRQRDPWTGCIVWLPAEFSELAYANDHMKAGDTISAFPGSWVQSHWTQLMDIFNVSDDLPF